MRKVFVFYLFLFFLGGGQGLEKPEVHDRLNRKQPEWRGLTDLSRLHYRFPKAARSSLETK